MSPHDLKKCYDKEISAQSSKDLKELKEEVKEIQGEVA